MRMSFAEYLMNVRLYVDDLTNGVVDLDDMPDVVDLGELYEDEITPREAAREILEENGFPID